MLSEPERPASVESGWTTSHGSMATRGCQGTLISTPAYLRGVALCKCMRTVVEWMAGTGWETCLSGLSYGHDAPTRPCTGSPASMGSPLLLPPTLCGKRQVNRLAQRRDESSRVQSGIDSLLILTVPSRAPWSHPVIKRIPHPAQRCRCDGKGTGRGKAQLVLPACRSHQVIPSSFRCFWRLLPGASNPVIHGLHGRTDARWWCRDPLAIMQPRSRAVEAASNTARVSCQHPVCLSGLGSSEKVKYTSVLVPEPWVGRYWGAGRTAVPSAPSRVCCTGRRLHMQSSHLSWRGPRTTPHPPTHTHSHTRYSYDCMR